MAYLKRSEHDEQVAVCQWLFYAHIPYYAVPNGQKRDVRIAVKLKAEGVVPGIPDLCIPVTPPKYPQYKGTYLEMKTVERRKEKDGGCSPDQIKWHKILKDNGHAVLVGYGYDDAIKQLEELGY